MIEKKCLTLQKILPGVASQLAKDESARQRFLICETCFKVIQAKHCRSCCSQPFCRNRLCGSAIADSHTLRDMN